MSDCLFYCFTASRYSDHTVHTQTQTDTHRHTQTHTVSRLATSTTSTTVTDCLDDCMEHPHSSSTACTQRCFHLPRRSSSFMCSVHSYIHGTHSAIYPTSTMLVTRPKPAHQANHSTQPQKPAACRAITQLTQRVAVAAVLCAKADDAVAVLYPRVGEAGDGGPTHVLPHLDAEVAVDAAGQVVVAGTLVRGEHERERS